MTRASSPRAKCAAAAATTASCSTRPSSAAVRTARCGGWKRISRPCSPTPAYCSTPTAASWCSPSMPSACRRWRSASYAADAQRSWRHVEVGEMACARRGAGAMLLRQSLRAGRGLGSCRTDRGPATNGAPAVISNETAASSNIALDLPSTRSPRRRRSERHRHGNSKMPANAPARGIPAVRAATATASAASPGVLDRERDQRVAQRIGAKTE